MDQELNKKGQTPSQRTKFNPEGLGKNKGSCEL